MTYDPFAFCKALLSSNATVNAKFTGQTMATVYADGKTGKCWPTQTQLAEKTGLSISSVKRAIGELRELGYLGVAPNRGKGFITNNVYWLRIPTPRKAVSTDVEPPAIRRQTAPAPKLPPAQTLPELPQSGTLPAFPTEPVWATSPGSH